MSLSKVQIVNMALLDAGGQTLTAVPDSTNVKESDLIVAYYDLSLATVLGEHPWRFAKKWASLAENGSYTFVDDTYDGAWQLPADFVRFSDLEGIGPLEYKFARRDTHLLTTGLDAFEIEYIALITDTTKYPNYFSMALRKRLAADVAPSLRRKGGKDPQWFEQAYIYALDLAKTKDSREDRQSEARIQRHTASNDSWVQARG